MKRSNSLPECMERKLRRCCCLVRSMLFLLLEVKLSIELAYRVEPQIVLLIYLHVSHSRQKHQHNIGDIKLLLFDMPISISHAIYKLYTSQESFDLPTHTLMLKTNPTQTPTHLRPA